MSRKKSFKVRVAELLDHAQVEFEKADNWSDLHNRIFGVGAKCQELFPDHKERIQLSETEEFKTIQELIEKKGGEAPLVKSVEQVSGKFNLRLPKSIHAALLLEAEAENVSLNQLCVAKLACQLRAVVKS